MASLQSPRPPLTVRLWHPGRPKPKQSARFSRNGKRVFQDPAVVEAERDLRRTMRKEVKRLRLRDPYLGPVTIDVLFLLEMDGVYASYKQSGYRVDALNPPDADNLCKLVKDALKGQYGLFLDDAQVIELRAKKVLSPVTGTYIRIYLTDPNNLHQWRLKTKALDKARSTPHNTVEKFMLKEEQNEQIDKRYDV